MSATDGRTSTMNSPTSVLYTGECRECERDMSMSLAPNSDTMNGQNGKHVRCGRCGRINNLTKR